MTSRIYAVAAIERPTDMACLTARRFPEGATLTSADVVLVTGGIWQPGDDEHESWLWWWRWLSTRPWTTVLLPYGLDRRCLGAVRPVHDGEVARFSPWVICCCGDEVARGGITYSTARELDAVDWRVDVLVSTTGARALCPDGVSPSAGMSSMVDRLDWTTWVIAGTRDQDGSWSTPDVFVTGSEPTLVDGVDEGRVRGR